MGVRVGLHRTMRRPPRAGPACRHETDAAAPRNQGTRRSVAGLRRHDEIVAAPQFANQGQGLARGRPLRHRDRCVDVGIAREHLLAAAERQDVQLGPRKAQPDRTNERRGQQHVAEPAERDDQNARPLG
jgi:hypothetical protein